MWGTCDLVWGRVCTLGVGGTLGDGGSTLGADGVETVEGAYSLPNKITGTPHHPSRRCHAARTPPWGIPPTVRTVAHRRTRLTCPTCALIPNA